MSISVDASSASSSCRISRSQPAPSAILLSASLSARYLRIAQSGQNDHRRLGQPKLPGG
jgi:hypothetical protein